MSSISDLVAAKLEKPMRKRALFFYIPAATPIRFWTGFGDYETAATDDLDPEEIYDGAGLLVSAPEISQLRNGTAERLDIVLSGTKSATREYVNNPALSLYGEKIHMGVVYFNDDWTPVDDIAWLWTGTIGPVSSRWSNNTAQVTLSCVTSRARRKAGGARYWTNANHRSRNPTDGLCKRVTLYSIGTQTKWPD